jgi:hypothetical protein
LILWSWIRFHVINLSLLRRSGGVTFHKEKGRVGILKRTFSLTIKARIGYSEKSLGRVASKGSLLIRIASTQKLIVEIVTRLNWKEERGSGGASQS